VHGLQVDINHRMLYGAHPAQLLVRQGLTGIGCLAGSGGGGLSIWGALCRRTGVSCVIPDMRARGMTQGVQGGPSPQLATAVASAALQCQLGSGRPPGPPVQPSSSNMRVRSTTQGAWGGGLASRGYMCVYPCPGSCMRPPVRAMRRTLASAAVWVSIAPASPALLLQRWMTVPLAILCRPPPTTCE
jgi:hypothetical protein